MGWKLGNTSIGEIYLGSTKIGQAYLGSTLVYQSSAPAPVVAIPGLIEPFAGTTVPTGYLLCDGSAVSRTTYATLYAVIGDTFGAGDGVDTFNLPDLSGRVPLGVSSTHLLGSTGGSETVTLVEAELPAHTHEVPQHGHADTIGATTPAFSHTITQPAFNYNKPNINVVLPTSGYSFTAVTGSGSTAATRSTNVAVSAHASANCTMSGSVANKDAFNSNSSGGGLSHSNMQPYTVFNYIICTGGV